MKKEWYKYNQKCWNKCGYISRNNRIEKNTETEYNRRQLPVANVMLFAIQLTQLKVFHATGQCWILI